MNSGKSLEDIAAENGASVQTIANVNRKETPAAPLTPVVAAQIFTTDKGKNFSSGIDNGFVVGQVTNVALPADTAKADGKELKDLEDLTGRSLGQDILGQFTASLSKDKNIKINQARLEQLYGKPQSADTQTQ